MLRDMILLAIRANLFAKILNLKLATAIVLESLINLVLKNLGIRETTLEFIISKTQF